MAIILTQEASDLGTRKRDLLERGIDLIDEENGLDGWVWFGCSSVDCLKRDDVALKLVVKQGEVPLREACDWLTRLVGDDNIEMDTRFRFAGMLRNGTELQLRGIDVLGHCERSELSAGCGFCARREGLKQQQETTRSVVSARDKPVSIML